MPIDSTHPEYDDAIGQWRKCRDFYRGARTVKAAGDVYLPNFFERKNGVVTPEGMRQYKAYLNRAGFYGAVGRTVRGLVGAAMRKAPVFDGPTQIRALADDLLGTGADLSVAPSQILSEQLITGRVGLLLDRKTNPGQTAATNRPLQVCIYRAESIINWSANDNDDIEWAVLHEQTYEPDPDDQYKWIKIDQYREIILDGRYIQRLHIKDNERDEFIVTDVTPTVFGSALDFLPFVLLTPMGETIEIYEPPLMDLVDVNHAHYCKQADLDHGEHFTALPTPYAAGVLPDELGDSETLTLGGQCAYAFSSPQAKISFGEFSGAGLGQLAGSIDKLEQRMAALGARLLSGAPRAVETAEAARIRTAGENATLSGTVKAAESGLLHLFEMAGRWSGVSGAVNLAMNDDFIDIEIDPQTLTALTQALQAASISHDTYLYNLQRGEMLPPGRSRDDERALIDMDGGGLALADNE